MLRPFHSIAEGETLHGDVCIIGTGPAGLTLARALQHTGLTVILLEAGRSRVEPVTQNAYAGEVLNPTHPPAQMYRQRRLGGTSGIWGGRCTPLDEVDFLKRDHVPFSGWPFPHTELSQYYREAQEAVEAGEFDYNAESALNNRPLIGGFHDPYVLTTNIERYSPPTRFWRRHREELSRSSNIIVISGATCLRFDTGHDGNIMQAANCVGADGRTFAIRARSFVAAVGGLETVRLLAFSKVGLDSGWLGRNYMCHVEINFGGLRIAPRPHRSVIYGFEKSTDGVYVKRRFTLTPERQAQMGILNAAVRIHHASILDPSQRDPVLSALFLARKFIIPEYSRHFSINNGGDASKYSLVDTNPAILEITKRRGFFASHVRNVALGLPGIMKFGAHWVSKRYISDRKIPYIALKNKDGAYALNLYGEQAPNPDSRVMLGGEVDQHGVPRLRIDWRAQDIDYRTVAYTIREIRRAMEASGCGTVAYDDERLDADVRQQTVPVGGHHIGTTRMSDDPRQGVVNRFGQVHGTGNLYVAGSAVFPTSGQANPTLTIVALSLRLAEHLRGRLGA